MNLSSDALLRSPPAQVDAVEGAARVREFALHGRRLGFRLPVPHEPRVAAVRVEKGEVRVSLGQVGGRCLCAL